MEIRTIGVGLLLALCGAWSALAAEPSAVRPSIEGVVSGPDGKPVDGVRVDVSTAAPRVGPGIFCPSCYLDCAKSAKTDAEGKFAIENVDPTLKFRLVLAKPGLRTLETDLIDPLLGPASLSLEELPDDVDPARVVSGIVRLNGSPVAGALVYPFGAKTAEMRWWGQVDGVDSTVTDENGFFAMPLPANYQAIDIEIRGDGMCGEQLALLEPGREPLAIEARTGATVVGRLVSDGNPVAGMSVAVVQLGRSTDDGIFIKAVGAVTDEQGRFEFRHLPPDQRYCIYSTVGEAKQTESPYILVTKTFAVPATGETRDVGSLEVAEPLSIRGTVKSVDGEPLPENLKIWLGRDPAWDLVAVPVKQDGSFQATGLPPETYEIGIAGRQLAVVHDQIPYQMQGESSFGLKLRESVDGLVIPVRAKEAR